MHHEQPPTSGEHLAAAEDAEPSAPDAANASAGLLQLGEPEQREVESTVRPQIWVASLSDYNNSVVHGAWLDAAQDQADLQAGIAAMLAASPLTARTGEPAEEWAIHDYQGFGTLQIYEHENLSWISRVAMGIAEHGLAFAAYADVMEDEELLDGFEDDYLGHYDDLHTYVEELINDLGYDHILDQNLPASIRPYVKIDVAATARDLELGGDLRLVAASDGGVWIFRG